VLLVFFSSSSSVLYFGSTPLSFLFLLHNI